MRSAWRASHTSSVLGCALGSSRCVARISTREFASSGATKRSRRIVLGVRPLQVVDQEHDRLLLRGFAQQPPDRVEQPEAIAGAARRDRRARRRRCRRRARSGARAAARMRRAARRARAALRARSGSTARTPARRRLRPRGRSTRSRRRCARTPAAPAAQRVLPMPGSPESTHSCPLPRLLSASRALSRRMTSMRPTNGSRRRRAFATRLRAPALRRWRDRSRTEHLDRRREAIAAPVHGLDRLLLRAVLAERAPRVADAPHHRRFVDVLARPQRRRAARLW